MGHRLLSYSAGNGNGSSSKSVKDGVEELLEVSSFLGPVSMAQLESLKHDVEMVNSAIRDALVAATDSLNGR